MTTPQAIQHQGQQTPPRQTAWGSISGQTQLLNEAVESIDLMTNYRADMITDPVGLALIARRYNLPWSAGVLEMYAQASASVPAE